MTEKISKNKKLIMAGILVLLIIFIGIYMLNNKTVKCTMEKELIKGMDLTDNLKVILSFGKVNKIYLNKEIKINDYYDKKNTYYDSIEKLFRNTYLYLGDNAEYIKDDKTVTTKIKTKREGIVLDNITITQNGIEDTTLRYDSETNLKSEKAININDKISKSELKKKVEKFGYKCR